MTASRDGLFIYDPLPTPTSTRLVRLLDDDPSAPLVYGAPVIQLSIETVDLNDKPDFDALSYTWGSPFPEEINPSDSFLRAGNEYLVAINGKAVPVTRNLYDFLCQIRRTKDKLNETAVPSLKTPLISAAEEGLALNVGSYLLGGADINAQDQLGKTALHYAAENGHLSIVQHLVSFGADVSLQDQNGFTPLECARQGKSIYCAEVSQYLSTIEGEKNDKLTGVYPLVASRSLWIDALCINQADIAERNAQVSIMSRIYSQAATVIAWLGVEDEYTKLVYQALNDPKNSGLRMWFRHVWRASLEMRSQYKHFPKADSKSIDDLQCRGLEQFFKRRWFHRVWIIQEFAMAQRIRMFCGSVEFSHMTLFTKFQDTRMDYPIGETQDLLGILRSAGYAGVAGSEAAQLMDVRARSGRDTMERDIFLILMKNNNIQPVESWTDGLTIQMLMTMAWNFKATDPRDKVFSLLSLCRPAGIVPDYSVSTTEIFTNFAGLFMKGCVDDQLQDWHTGACTTFECLEGLSYIQQPPHTLGYVDGVKDSLPSWVPDFNSSLSTNRLWSDRFNAGRLKDKHTPIILQSTDPRTLRVNGTYHDEIVKIAEFGRQNAVRPYCVEEWLDLVLGMVPKYHTGESRIEALWRTLITDDLSGTSKNPENDARRGFRDFLRRNIVKPSQCPPLLDLLALLKQSDPYDALPTVEEIESLPNSKRYRADMGPAYEAFHIRFARYQRSRCLFITKRGYMGMGPSSMEKGDEVWLVSGSRTPYVLRKLPEGVPKRHVMSSFKRIISGRGLAAEPSRMFIGESYVHGIMDGEAIRRGGRQYSPLSLC